jgi:hypothetical protein
METVLFTPLTHTHIEGALEGLDEVASHRLVQLQEVLTALQALLLKSHHRLVEIGLNLHYHET